MPSFDLSALTLRGRATYVAHTFKSIAKQHHTELMPMFRELIPRGAVVFDVGAHVGQFAKLFAQAAGTEGRVYAFEPGSYARSILERMVRLKRLDTIDVVPFGLGEREEELALKIAIKRNGVVRMGVSHLGSDDRGGTVLDEAIGVTTIDDFVGRHGIDRLDFLKADIEGWEVRMLAGGRKTLQRFRPALMLELINRQLVRAGDSIESAFELLGVLGYRGHRWRVGGLVPLEEPGEGDIVFLPVGGMEAKGRAGS